MKKLSFLLIFILAIFNSYSAFTHQKNKTDDVKTTIYICFPMGKSEGYFDYQGGDGKFGSEKGSFTGKYYNREIDKTKRYMLKIHGNENQGGVMNISSLKSDWSVYATILHRDQLENLPHSSLKNKNNIDDQILWLGAFRSNYRFTVFMTFVRSTLRLSIFYNSPTRVVGHSDHYFFDCKKDGSY